MVHIVNERIIMYSLDDPTRSLFNTNFRISLESDGKVLWNAPGVVKTTCGIDVEHFPFDYQICYIRIERYLNYAMQFIRAHTCNCQI